MANAPKKRPPTQRSDRRSPRGHRPVPTNRDLRTQLAAASNRLREVESPSLAEVVEQLLAPRGWVSLRDTDPAGSAGPNLAVVLSTADRDRIVAGAASAGTAVTDDVNEGFRKAIAGEYVPRKPARARYGAAKDKTNLNVTPAASLRQVVEEVTGMRASQVAADYLLHKYKAGQYADDYAGAPLPPGKACNMNVPRRVRELIRTRAAAAGRKATDDVNEGFQKYLAGDFTPEAPVWADTSDMVNLKATPADSLQSQVVTAGGPRPLQVAIAYLLDKYNIDPTRVQ